MMKRVLFCMLTLTLLLGTVGCAMPWNAQNAMQAATPDYKGGSNGDGSPSTVGVVDDANCDAVEILVNGAALPGFSSGRVQYWVSVTNLTEAPTVTATAASTQAIVDVVSTVEKAVITVTSADQTNEKVYTVTFVDTATYDKYDLDLYTLPYWDGNIVYNETIMFVIDNEAPLLYTPDTVLSVRSSDLKTEYVLGQDYEVRDGKIVRLEGSRMPYFTEEQFYPTSNETSPSGQTQQCNVPGHPLILFSEGHYFYEHQVVVTYTHTDEWEGFVPQKSTKLHKFVERAEAGEELNIVFYGDSITAGGNPSGQGENPVDPGTPRWSTIVTNALQARFPNATINEINTAQGGKNSQWGLENIQGRVVDKDPDLLVLAWGMNDTGRMPTDYAELNEKMIKAVLKRHPDCEILLVSTMLPHDKLSRFYGNQRLFEGKLYVNAAKYDNIDVAPVTSAHTSILEHKRYFDMTGNNVNHPTDYLTRIYAQTVLRVLLG